MATIDAIKAALVHPPASSSDPEIGVLGPDKKLAENQNLGAKKKKKSVKPRPGIEVSKTLNPNLNITAKAPTLQTSKPDKPAGLNEQQLQKLNQALAKNKDPGLTERRALAKEINLSEYQVGGWFKKARNNVGEAGKKDVNRPHFLASKLVQPADAKRHMEKNTVGRNVKSNGSKLDKKAKVSHSNEIGFEDKKASFGGIFSSLKSGSSKTRKLSGQPKRSSFKKLDIPALSSMNQIMEVMQAVGGSNHMNSKNKDVDESKEVVDAAHNLLKKPSENQDLEVMVLDEAKKPVAVAEVIDIVDDDQTMEVDVLVDLVPTKVYESEKNIKTLEKKKEKKHENMIGLRIEDEIVKLKDSNEKLQNELKEKTKIVKNLEIKIPQMISEFTKCVGDKDEVISAKDIEIKTNKQKLANFEKDTKLLQNRNKNTSGELAMKIKEAETLKKELSKDSKEKMEHLHKMEGLDAKVAKLLGVLAKKDEELVQLNVKSKELQKKEDESRKLLAKEKEVSLKLKSKDKDSERKNKARIQENNEKVKELEKLIKVRDQNLKIFQSNDSIKTKSTLEAQKKQIVKLRSTVKFQEKEIISLKDKEGRLSVQVADLECDNYTKSAELEFKNSELDKVMSKVKSGKVSDRRKLSIYEATKDYIEKLKENRKLKANLKNQEAGSEAIEVINVEEEDSIMAEEETMINNYPSSSTDSLIEQMPLNTGGARPRVATFVNRSARYEGNSEHLKNDSSPEIREPTSPFGLLTNLQMVDLLVPKLMMKTGTGHFASMVSHEVIRVETPPASLVSHVVSWIEDHTDMDDILLQHVQSIHPACRKIAHRSSTGQWGQVYRVRGMHKEVVMRRAAKRGASVDMGQGDDDTIPIKKRKLLDLVEEHDDSVTTGLCSQDPYPDMDEDHSNHVYEILEYLITMASTATTLPDEVPGVQYCSMVAHRLYYTTSTSSRYSSVTHKATTASKPSQSISFLSHTQHQTNTDNFSPLSHQVTGVTQSTITTNLLSHQVPELHQPTIISSVSYLADHHHQANPSHCFYSNVSKHLTDFSLQDVKRTKRHLEEDMESLSPHQQKKMKLSGSQEIVLDLVLELVSEMLTFHNQQEVSSVTEPCYLQSFVAHQVYRVEGWCDAQSSFISHQIVSTKPSLPSLKYSLLSHQVTPSVSPQAVSSSLLSHQGTSTHVLPTPVPHVRISSPHSCQTSLLTKVYNPAIHHNIFLQSGHLSIKPETGRGKRMLEDRGDGPGWRKMIRLSTELPSISITASCKREREDDDDCLLPAKRLKMSRVCGLILHYSPVTLLHTLPHTSKEWQIVKYHPRQALCSL